MRPTVERVPRAVMRLSSLPRLPWRVWCGKGGKRTVTVQLQVPSAVTEMSQDALVGASMANGAPMSMVDLRQHDLHREVGTQATLPWRTEASHVAVPALSTCHQPIPYRYLCTQGSYVAAQPQRRSFTPERQGVSPSQHVSPRVGRLACSLAVVCGVSLRQSALLCAALWLLPTTQSALTRWREAMGAPGPTPAAIVQPRLAGH